MYSKFVLKDAFTASNIDNAIEHSMIDKVTSMNRNALIFDLNGKYIALNKSYVLINHLLETLSNLKEFMYLFSKFDSN